MPDKPRDINLRFPIAGLDERQAYQSQGPYTTRDCQNVRPDDPIEGRQRGGTRPGLVKDMGEQLGSGANIWGLGHIDLVHQGPALFEDTFDKIGANWSQSPFDQTPSLSNASPEGGQGLTATGTLGGGA